MHDPFAWSFPMGRLFGITVRVHLFFPFVALGLILWAAFRPTTPGVPPQPAGLWIDAAILLGLLFFSVLLHELGHSFTARAVGGDSQEILLWPLGGLARVELPMRPLPHFLCAAAGPAVNLVLFLAAMLLMLVVADRPYQPIWNPLPGYFPFRYDDAGHVLLYGWDGKSSEQLSAYAPVVWLARLAWLNYFMFLLNVVLVGFPLDGGAMLQAALWPSMGYRQSMLFAIVAGFVVVFVLGLYSVVTSQMLALCLALFIYFTCQRQWIVLETGGDEGLFGYDFSQGYTSLERDQPPSAPPVRRVSWWKRWLQRRQARKIQRDLEQREQEERRLDELLEKVHREGQAALTDEERRFMKRVSDRYRNRR
jgi:stage IV sporulation protein FB